ncbi:MAG: thiamine pyrophosphate-dependent enzyme [Pseudomonadota bacterium]
MKRDACLEVLARLVGDQIVVAVYQAAFDWLVIKPEGLTYVSVGVMGQASSHALGLALGRPDKRVIVLDGDGSLLMNLGSLVTIAAVAPRNLVHFVCENGIYEANGGHPIPGRGTVSFTGFAKAAGYPKVYEFGELSDFEARIPAILEEDGPVFVDLKVEPGALSPQDYEYIHSPAPRQAFRAALRRQRPRA